MRVPGRPVIRFMSQPPPGRTPCAGQWQEWDAATDDAVEACGYCPARAWCRQEALAVRHAGFTLTGVWHGTIYGDQTTRSGVA